MNRFKIINSYVAWRAGTTKRVIATAPYSTYADGTDSLESIPGILKRLQIRALWSLFIFTDLVNDGGL
jgi:hypothetical protein